MHKTTTTICLRLKNKMRWQRQHTSHWVAMTIIQQQQQQWRGNITIDISRGRRQCNACNIFSYLLFVVFTCAIFLATVLSHDWCFRWSDHLWYTSVDETELLAEIHTLAQFCLYADICCNCRNSSANKGAHSVDFVFADGGSFDGSRMVSI